ncbi:3-hydroxybutyryl-CoA dehydrogenase [Deferribacter desulfuricans SSM1]|uniref:3-hydroxybutyryl-CoA dehydrogenase n=1 Tax=Deferribacter desulfuricans (strain DSM 14783 / JCM 11476 / NBRC 101012 / SSM1) TaxID=639282 RepID=D3P9A1_DEFDS|nr:3-hydroxybutyryl-CoA dehydrogenase [Deferribacter desulfuricans]BAI81291.1 3-hydroxybutyryl-CoA dehydrogenase [Deferribacter desulfuricans SSM1]
MKVGVIGAGQMGSGIAHVLSQHGNEVYLYDVSNEQLKKALVNIEKNMMRQAKKGVFEESRIAEFLSNIKTIESLEDIKDAEFVIEAATENEDIKLDLFRKLDEITDQNTILATNTSSISITKIAAVTKRPEKVIGMHFMNPVPVMKLVEIIKGLATDDDTFNKTVELAKSLGKEVAVASDYAGFIVNRILIPMINEAIFAHFEGVASIEDIDKAMKLGTNQPMGPFELADFIGLDTVLAIMEVLYNEFKYDKYRPCPLLVNMVRSGRLGRKTGRGFYDYTK